MIVYIEGKEDFCVCY